jgi:lysophospholipase L1-like esterase
MVSWGSRSAIVANQNLSPGGQYLSSSISNNGIESTEIFASMAAEGIIEILREIDGELLEATLTAKLAKSPNGVWVGAIIVPAADYSAFRVRVTNLGDAVAALDLDRAQAFGGTIAQIELGEYQTAIDAQGSRLNTAELAATERLIDELKTGGVWNKLRYLALLSGDGNGYQVDLIGNKVMRPIGGISVTYNKRSGLSVSGSAASMALKTGFTASQAGLAVDNHFKAAYILQPQSSGVLFGVGDAAHGGNNLGPYLCFGGTNASTIGGANLNYTTGALGLQSITANTSNVISRDRYRQIQSLTNPKNGSAAPNTESIALGHWNGAGNFNSNGVLGALVEATALTQLESGSLSGALDRYHFRVNRKQALEAVFFGDSITAGVGVAQLTDRFSSQTARRLGLIENNKGFSGMCLQPGSFDATVASGMSRYNNEIIGQTPSFVFILVGANDIYRAPDYNVATYQANLQTLISDCIAAGIPTKHIFVGTVPYASDAWYAANPGGSRAEAEQYAQAGRAAAQNTGAVLVDVYNAMRDGGAASLIPDGLHPNEAGATVIADAFIATFRGAIG